MHVRISILTREGKGAPRKRSLMRRRKMGRSCAGILGVLKSLCIVDLVGMCTQSIARPPHTHTHATRLMANVEKQERTARPA